MNKTQLTNLLMENKIIATTTNSIENTEIERYIDLISTNVVIGTNFFSDLGASFTDILGGTSNSYQEKLEEIYIVGIDKLKLKAANIGANAILGLKIDFDEISGKGKSMFMVSVLGTAVSIKPKSDKSTKLLNDKKLIISNKRVEQEVSKRNIISKFENDKFPTQEEWLYLLNNPMEGIVEQLLEKYLENFHKGPNDFKKGVQLLLSNTNSYFKSIDREIAINVLYENMTENPIPIYKIIEANNLFSPVKIIELIVNDNFEIAIDCLSINMDYYSNNDLTQMQTIIELLYNLPDKGTIVKVKGIIGKAKEKFICRHKHTNSVDSEFCENINCGENIKGLTKQRIYEIEMFETKVDSLAALMNVN